MKRLIRDIISRIRGNISFYLPERFSKQLNESITKRKNITFILKNTNLSYYFGEYFEDHEMIHLNNTEINFTIIQRERYFYNNQNYEKESSLFSRVIFSIRNNEKISRQFIVFKDSDGISHFTDFHKYIKSPKK